jgi:hypothetical protein
MTSHQWCVYFFIEQLYRGFLKNEPASSIENTLFVSSRINNKAQYFSNILFLAL